jgi:hypothetical protein
MESVIRNVRDIDSRERQALEHVLGRQLRENQQVIIQVVTVPTAVADNPAPKGSEKLPAWCNVYDGLSDEEIAEVESVALRRSGFSRPSE